MTWLLVVKAERKGYLHLFCCRSVICMCTLNINLKILCCKFVGFVSIPTFTPDTLSNNLLAVRYPLTPHVFYPNKFTEWLMPTQIIGDNLGMAYRHIGKLANSIPYLWLSRQTADLGATFLGFPHVTSHLLRLHPAAGWLQFALGSLLQFSVSQSYPPLQKKMGNIMG